MFVSISVCISYSLSVWDIYKLFVWVKKSDSVWIKVYVIDTDKNTVWMCDSVIKSDIQWYNVTNTDYDLHSFFYCDIDKDCKWLIECKFQSVTYSVSDNLIDFVWLCVNYSDYKWKYNSDYLSDSFTEINSLYLSVSDSYSDCMFDSVFENQKEINKMKL